LTKPEKYAKVTPDVEFAGIRVKLLKKYIFLALLFSEKWV